MTRVSGYDPSHLELVSRYIKHQKKIVVGSCQEVGVDEFGGHIHIGEMG